ncbi:MAG: RNA polymerase sigma factor [Clostridia bacterium]|nr:RNA polymerase sigma factor [Clostridia bacterium]
MDLMEPLLAYTDEIWKLAFARCGNTVDADDLTQETYLAALTAIRRGREIRYPKTWLANTLMHIWNSRLRERYRAVTISYSEGLPDIAEEVLIEPAEETDLRTHIASLTKLYRDVIVLHYISGLSVEQIADRLEIPAGTVKRRLHDGREKMRKGKEKMETREMERITPMCVSLSWNGSMISTEIFHFAEGHLVQQILAAAYEKPLTDGEIAEKIGIPVYYIEDLLDKAAELEILVKTESGRYYTDACLSCPEDWEKSWNGCRQMVVEHLAIYTDCLHRVEEAVENLAWYGELNPRQQWKLKRFAFLETVQRSNHCNIGADKLERPKRKDGGNWTLIGGIFPLGYVEPFRPLTFGGHRSTGRASFHLHEFDTSIWDNACRFRNIDWIEHMSALLYAVQASKDPLEMGVPADMIESMNYFTEAGLFTMENGIRKVDIPVVNGVQWRELMNELCGREADRLRAETEPFIRAWLDTCHNSLPAHLREKYRIQWLGRVMSYYEPAVYGILYDKGIHLQGVDFCCPPAVLVIE